MPSSILLRGGTLLIHDEQDHVIPQVADILIEDDLIVKIEDHISTIPSPDTEIIDARNKIISPGFIDTHHHLWQTQLKGRHADHILLDYMPTGNLTSSFFSPTDIFWGQLGGALEALNSGTTTVVDHAHMNYSPSHTNHAIAGTTTSGIRSVFCYTPTILVTAWQPQLAVNYDILSTWVLPHLEKISGHLKSNPRVTLGFGFDAYALLPPPALQALFKTVRDAGCKIITSHFGRNPITGPGPSLVKTLSELELLGSDVLLSHASEASEDDIRLLAEKNVSVSCTPTNEIYMSLGEPMAFKQGLEKCMSLGCDSHSVVRGSMVEQMRVALLVARGARNAALLKKGNFPSQSKPSVEQVFNLATVDGARAVGLEDQIGRLKVGHKADILVWGASGPHMVCAGKQNPLAAIVGHAGTSDVEYVIVDGIIRKKKGILEKLVVSGLLEANDDISEKLAAIRIDEKQEPALLGSELAWEDVARQLERSREDIEGRIKQEGLDEAKAKAETTIGFGFDISILAD